MQTLARIAELVPTPAGRPAVVGITGPVAVGKSTTAHLLTGALAPRATGVLGADGFLTPNAALVARGDFERKGHPQTYDVEALVATVAAVCAGREARAPVYSHLTYDRAPDEEQVIPAPVDVLVVEGLHLLHDRFAPLRLDLSVYVDAAPDVLEAWYLARLRGLVEAARSEPEAFELFRALGTVPDDEVEAVGRSIWATVNVPNIEREIAPTRSRADVVVVLGADHGVAEVVVR